MRRQSPIGAAFVIVIMTASVAFMRALGTTLASSMVLTGRVCSFRSFGGCFWSLLRSQVSYGYDQGLWTRRGQTPESWMKVSLNESKRRRS